RMVIRGPAAIRIGEVVEPAGIPHHGVRHVVVVVRGAFQPRGRQHRLVDPIGVHLEEQVLDAGAGARIGDWRLVRPTRPHVRVAVDDHPLSAPPARPCMICRLRNRYTTSVPSTVMQMPANSGPYRTLPYSPWKLSSPT